MEWLGRAKVDFTHAPSPIEITEKDGVKTNLLEICERITPACKLNPLLFNGHLQTIWTAAQPHVHEIWYRRKIFHADSKAYEGTFTVDFVSKPFQSPHDLFPPRTLHFTDEQLENLSSDDEKPMLIVLHGLSGGSHEVYLRHAIAPLIGNGDWEVCVINSRGCAGSKITSGVLYNARATWDVRQLVKWLRETFPRRPLFGLGFSLGGNILTNYCGEEGSSCLLKAAVVCSNPFSLELANKSLQNSFIGRHLYLRVLGDSMKALVRRHRKELELYTNLDLEAIDKVKYLQDFDREIQCPTWGYPTEYAYYRDASSTDSILSISIPFVALQARDDPLVPDIVLPYTEFQQNPCTVLITTSLGGHLSWFESGGSRWYPRPICGFLNHMANNVHLDALVPLSSPTWESRAGGAIYVPMRRKLAVKGDSMS